MTAPSDDETTPRPTPPAGLGRDQNNWPLARRSPVFWIFVSGIGFIVGMVALIWIGVHALNRTFDASNLSTAGQNERIAAKADHDAILAVGYLCANESSKSPQTIKIADHLLTMAADNDANQRTDGSKPPPQMSLEAPSYILAAIVMSHHIGWARIALAEEERWSSVAMQIFQWSIVLIGAITTVLISIKTIFHERPGSHLTIGVAAIIFSTVGTAIATMNSFYAPRVAHDHSERSLQTLQTLHLQLATGITREENVCAPLAKWPADWRIKRIKAIAEQYAAVMSTAQAPANTPEGDEPSAALNNSNGSQDKGLQPAGAHASSLSATNGPPP